MTDELKPTRIRDLVALLVVAALATWILVRVFYGQLPPIPIYAGASLYPVAVIEVVAAFLIRGRINEHRIGDGPRQLHPIVAARAAATRRAPQESSLTTGLAAPQTGTSQLLGAGGRVASAVDAPEGIRRSRRRRGRRCPCSRRC